MMSRGHFRRRRRQIVVSAITTVCATLGTGTSLHAQAQLAQLDPFAITPDVVDDVPFAAASLFDVRVGRITHTPMRVYDTGKALLVPVAAVFQLVGFPHTTSSGRVSGEVRTDHRRVIIDSDARTVAMGTHVDTLAPQAIIAVHGSVYLSLTYLEQMLGSDVVADRSDASVTILNADSLPIARRMALDAAHAAFVSDAAMTPPLRNVVRPNVPSWGIGSLDYAISNISTFGETMTSFTSAVSTTVVGGALVTRLSGTGTTVRSETAWQGAWPTGGAVTQLRIGDGTSGDMTSMRARGVFMTNAPYLRPVLLSGVPFDGALGPGWTVDAYRDGILVGFDSTNAAGRYTLTLPVHYGENPFRFVATGPLGQQVELSRTWRALPQMLPRRAFEYALDGGACLERACGWGSHGELRYGVLPNWTVRTGASHYTWNEDPNVAELQSRARPYAGTSVVPINGVSIDADVSLPTSVSAAQLRHAALWLDPTPGLTVSAAYQANLEAGGSVPSRPRGTTLVVKEWSLDAYLAGTPLHPGWEAHASAFTTPIGVRAGGRFGAIIPAGRATLRPYLRAARDISDQGTLAGLNVVALPNIPWGVLSQSWIQGTVEGGPGASPNNPRFFMSAKRAEVLLSRGDGEHSSHTDAGVRWQQGQRGATFTFRLVRAIGGVRSSMTMDVTNGTGPGGVTTAPRLTHVASGAVYWNDRIVTTPDPIVDRTGVVGIVFLDANGNGRRDPGEEAIPSVLVRVDGYVVRSDSSGRYEAWGLTPAQDAIVTIDTVSLASPWLAPSRNATIIRTGMNRGTVVDIPVIRAGVAEGSVTDDLVAKGPTSSTQSDATRNIDIGNADSAMSDWRDGGSVVVLTNLATASQTVVEIFSDGTWYCLGLPAGTYEAVLARAGATGTTASGRRVQFTVVAGKTTSHIRIPGSR